MAPGALLERLRPSEQLVDLLSSGPDGDGGKFSLIASDGDSRVGRLVRVDTDDDGHEYLLVSSVRNRQGTPDSDRGARSSFEPLGGKVPAGSPSFDSQTTSVASRHKEGNPARVL